MMNLGVGKVLSNNLKILQSVIKMLSTAWILAGLAECAGKPGGGGGLKPSILDLEAV